MRIKRFPDASKSHSAGSEIKKDTKLEATRTPPPGTLLPIQFEPGAMSPLLGCQMPWVIERMKASADFSDTELIRLRGQVQMLSKQDLHHLRRELSKVLPKWRRTELKGTEALAEKATVDKIMQMFGGPGRFGRLPLITKSQIRLARERNIDALLDRAALRLVNGNDGLFHMLNPGDPDNPDGFTFGSMDSITSHYELVHMISSMLEVGYSEKELINLAASDRAEAITGKESLPQQAELGVLAVLEAGMARVMERRRSFESVKTPEDLEDAPVLAKRLSQLRWVESRVARELGLDMGAPEEYTEDLAQLIAQPNADAVHEALDQRYETAMDLAIVQQLGTTGFHQLRSVQYERVPTEQVDAPVEVSNQRLPDDHPVRSYLADVRKRLDEGERSGVGGAVYANQTFPREILDRVQAGQLKVVGFDGSRECGVRYIRDRFGITDDGHRLGCRVMGLQGLYGSYPRSLVTLDDGQQFLLVSGYGESRLLNNVATLLLHEDEKGARVPEEKIVLATDHTDLEATFRGDMRNALEQDWEGPGSLDDIPTRLLILQNPPHLEQLFRDDLRWGTEPECALIPFRIAYRRLSDGSEERLVVPKVGGGGLYGDTAGQFMKAFYSTGFKNLIPDVIFNGAAGGFAATRGSIGFDDKGRPGLPEVEPGGLFMPTQSVEQYGDGRGPQPIPSLLGSDPVLWPQAAREAAEKSGIQLTGQHVAVMAPAIETYTMIHDLVSDGFASIDVEAGSIMEAARELGKTCTVVYTHSDDPRASEENPNTSLGRVAPFLEGSRYQPELFSFLKVLMDLSTEAAQ